MYDSLTTFLLSKQTKRSIEKAHVIIMINYVAPVGGNVCVKIGVEEKKAHAESAEIEDCHRRDGGWERVSSRAPQRGPGQRSCRNRIWRISSSVRTHLVKKTGVFVQHCLW